MAQGSAGNIYLGANISLIGHFMGAVFDLCILALKGCIKDRNQLIARLHGIQSCGESEVRVNNCPAISRLFP